MIMVLITTSNICGRIKLPFQGACLLCSFFTRDVAPGRSKLGFQPAVFGDLRGQVIFGDIIYTYCCKLCANV
jgi:hypothetical protein